MKKQSKKFMLAGVVLLAIAGLLALTSCKNDSVPEQGTSVQEETWLQEQKKELEDKTEGTITAPSYLTKGGLVDLAKLLRDLPYGVQVDLDLSQATGLTYIAAGTFIECPTLKSVELPSSVTEIGQYAFQACHNLTEVTIPAGVTTIGASAFQHCWSLTEVTIPAGVTTIGDFTFDNCRNLTEVTIPKGVTTIGDAAFQNCQNLTEVTIPKGVTTIGSFAFAFTDLTKVAIPEGVTTIGDYAFEGCSRLAEVIFQETGGWHLQDPMTNEIDADTIVVDDSSTNATNLKDYAGQWYGKYLIRK